MMDKKVLLYYAESSWLFEPYCSFCGNETKPIFNFDIKKRYFFPVRNMNFCKKCNEVFYVERIYFSIKQLNRKEYRIKKRFKAKDEYNLFEKEKVKE